MRATVIVLAAALSAASAAPQLTAAAEAAAVTEAPTEETTSPVPILRQINEVNEDGSYTFGFEAADGSFKLETREADGTVYGKYGYLDEFGELKVVEYGASNGTGFQPQSDLIPVAPPAPPLIPPQPPALPQQQQQAPQFPLQIPGSRFNPNAARQLGGAFGQPQFPGAGIPGQGFPGAGLPGQGFPGAGIPGQGFPGAGLPGQGFPGAGLPGQGFPGVGIPGQGFLSQGAPFPGAGIPGQGFPGQGFPGAGIPGLPGQGFPGNPAALSRPGAPRPLPTRPVDFQLDGFSDDRNQDGFVDGSPEEFLKGTPVPPELLPPGVQRFDPRQQFFTQQQHQQQFVTEAPFQRPVFIDRPVSPRTHRLHTTPAAPVSPIPSPVPSPSPSPAPQRQSRPSRPISLFQSSGAPEPPQNLSPFGIPPQILAQQGANVPPHLLAQQGIPSQFVGQGGVPFLPPGALPQRGVPPQFAQGPPGSQFLLQDPRGQDPRLLDPRLQGLRGVPPQALALQGPGGVPPQFLRDGRIG